MIEHKDSSSLPILLTISTAVILTAAGGWFLLDDDFIEAPSAPEPAADTRLVPAEDSTDLPDTVPSEPEEEQVQAIVVEEPVDEPADVATQSQDANLRKARLAAEADMLAYPTDQSALYYYNEILAVDAEHAIAKAELETTLGRIGQTAAEHMAAREYAEAYALAVLVAEKNPGHALVQDVSRDLDKMTNDFVELAIQHVQDGNDAEVDVALAAAESLPGRNPDYFVAVRESIENIRSSRIAEEQGELERVRLESLQASASWVEKVRSAILAGRLVAPVGENAIEYLAEPDAPEAEKEELLGELTTALLSECAANIDSGSLDEAASLLAVATDFLGDNDATRLLQRNLDQAFVDAESSRILATDDFVPLNMAPAIYPRRAQERNIEGWVEVVFTVTTTGETADIELQNSEPEFVFDRAAVEAVEQWTFQPRVFRGRPINQRAGARLVFKFE